MNVYQQNSADMLPNHTWAMANTLSLSVSKHLYFTVGTITSNETSIAKAKHKIFFRRHYVGLRRKVLVPCSTKDHKCYQEIFEYNWPSLFLSSLHGFFCGFCISLSVAHRCMSVSSTRSLPMVSPWTGAFSHPSTTQPAASVLSLQIQRVMRYSHFYVVCLVS